MSTKKIDARHHHQNDANKQCLWSEDWFEMFRRGGWMTSGMNDNKEMTMPIAYNNYHPYVCNLCKRGQLQNITLQKCTSCKVMKYCCRDHQKEDWAYHKLWCKPFTKIMKKKTIAEVEDRITDIDTWRREIKIPSNRIFSLMGSRAHTDHIQVVHLQPRCRRCFQAGRNPGVVLIVCPRCSGVAICKNCLGCSPNDTLPSEVGNWQTFHSTKEECEGHLIALCCSGMIVEHKTPLVATSDTNESSSPFAPKDWVEYFDRKGSDFDKGTQMPISILRKMAPVTALLTDSLSMSLTIQHVLDQLSLLKEDQTKLCIHVLGASANEEMAERAFLELGRLNPQLNQLDIVLVGPDLPLENVTNPFPEYLLPHETPVQCQGGIHKIHGLYHEQQEKIHNNHQPDLLVAFNAGITDPVHLINWRPTVKMLATKSTPFCITGYNSKEVYDIVEHCVKTSDFRESIQTRNNPFRGMRPYLDPVREESDLFYNNYFYAVLMK